MKLLTNNIFSLFAKYGVLHRDSVKNYADELSALLRQGFVQKRRLKKAVYYQLTPKALPLLDHYRSALLSSAELQAKLHPRSQFYQSLLTDLRFVSEVDEKAQAYLFLGDWQLRRTPTPLQLELVQTRYFAELESKKNSHAENFNT